jgi:PAS domain S-box-containing protein
MKTVTWPAKADWRFFASIFLVLFGVDVAVSLALNALAPPSVLKGAAVDAVAVTIISGPLLWLIVARGLARSAEVEKLRIDARVATILATSIDGIVTTDALGVVSHFNAGAEKIFGYAANEVVGRNISLLVPERARAAHAEHLGRFASGADNSRAMGTFATLEGRRKSGELFPVDISISKLDIDGNVMLTAVVRDVTERKRAETVLRETESFLRAVLNDAPITIWATDAAGVFTLSDGHALERVGLKPGEHVGESALDLYADLRFVDHAGGESTGREVLVRALAGETVVAVTELRGTYFENRIGPQFGSDGTVVGVVAVATDITERMEARAAERRSEERFRLTFEDAAIGMAIVSLDGRFLQVNQALVQSLGIPRAELLAQRREALLDGGTPGRAEDVGEEENSQRRGFSGAERSRRDALRVRPGSRRPACSGRARAARRPRNRSPCRPSRCRRSAWRRR